MTSVDVRAIAYVAEVSFGVRAEGYESARQIIQGLAAFRRQSEKLCDGCGLVSVSN
jgi:hypothetical protein